MISPVIPMPDLLAQSARWLDDQRSQHLASPIRYRRGDLVVDLDATVGRTVFRHENAYGMVTHHVSRDFLIRAQDLVLGGQPVEPEPGDEVIEISESPSRVHEVMSPTPDDPPWRYSDPQRCTLRIHTKHTGQENAS